MQNSALYIDPVSKEFYWHYLLPQSNFYDLTNVLDNEGAGPAVHPWALGVRTIDLPYSLIDGGTSPISDHLYVRKASVSILGPQVFNMGFAALIVENKDNEDLWYPMIRCADGEGVKDRDYPGAGIKLTNQQQFCATIQWRQYSGANYSGNFGPNLYRSVWLDVWGKIGG